MGRVQRVLQSDLLAQCVSSVGEFSIYFF